MKLQTLTLSLAFGLICVNTSFARSFEDKNHDSFCSNQSSEECLNEVSALNILHHTNKLEISQSRAALSKLQNASVREYARMLIAEHTENERLVWALARSEDVPLFYFTPATFEKAAQEVLFELPRSFFDRGFLLIQIQGHQRALFNLGMALTLVTDPQIRALIEQTIPVVQSHLEEAQELLASLG